MNHVGEELKSDFIECKSPHILLEITKTKTDLEHWIDFVLESPLLSYKLTSFPREYFDYDVMLSVCDSKSTINIKFLNNKLVGFAT